MRYVILVMALLLGSVVSGPAQSQTRLSLSIGGPGVDLGFVMSDYPTLVRIPGYPVYYDPRLDSNYFFYDGLYWVYQDDDWYSSTWYDGPWDLVSPEYVPLFVLRVPVRYYRRPPSYFRGWRADSAPRWGQHWGRNWEHQRDGWDRWDRRSVPRAAPLPSYQRHYSGSRYPHRLDQQHSIASRSYGYQPHDTASRQVIDQRRQHLESRGRDQQPDDRRQQQERQPRDRQQQDRRRQQGDSQRLDVQQQQQRNARQPQDFQQQRERQQQDRRQQEQRNARQQQDFGQQRERQQQNLQQQEQRNARQQQNLQQQRQWNARQQQDFRQQRESQQQNLQQQQQQRNAGQQQEMRQYQEQRSRQQQRSQPDENARGNEDKGRRRGPDKNRDRKEH